MSARDPAAIAGFLELAIDEALSGVAARDGGPFGAIVVRGDRVIARGHNRVTSRNDPTAHAEVEAIRAACSALGSYELRGCELYASCEPCPMCLGAILWSRVDRAYYAAGRSDAALAGFDDAQFYEQLALPGEQRSCALVHVPHARATSPFEAWLAIADRIRY